MSGLVFPTLPGLRIDVQREPYFATHTMETISGRELRSTWWSFPRYRYKLSFEVLNASKGDFQRLFGFFVRHLGPLDSFLWTDPEDNAVAAHYFSVANATSTTDFQLQRTLVADADLNLPVSRFYWPQFSDGYEPVFELNGAPTIFKNGTPQVLTTHYTLPGNGIVRFVTPPASGDLLSWTGSFYRRVRFDADNLPASRIVQSMWEAKAVTLVSVKPIEQAPIPVLIPTATTDSSLDGTLTGAINGTTGSDGNPTFTLRKTPLAGYPVRGYRNGVRLTSGTDFTVAGATVTMLAPAIPVAGDALAFDYYA
jgi:hypothetical protein